MYSAHSSPATLHGLEMVSNSEDDARSRKDGDEVRSGVLTRPGWAWMNERLGAFEAYAYKSNHRSKYDQDISGCKYLEHQVVICWS